MSTPSADPSQEASPFLDAERTAEVRGDPTANSRLTISRRNAVVAVVLALVAVLLTATEVKAETGTTARVSVASDGRQANDDVFLEGLSGDGRYVTFSSLASNLVTGDDNGTYDVFVKDRQSGATTRVSVASDGGQVNDHVFAADLSGDGRYVTFSSAASNLVPGDDNDAYDVFVHDRQTGATSRVTPVGDGTQRTGDSYGSSISADGRYVAFSHFAPGQSIQFFHHWLYSNSVSGGVIVVHDRQTGLTTAVGDGWEPSISGDGRFVAFQSGPGGVYLGGGETTPERTEVFLHDRTTATTTLVSRASVGTPGDDDSFASSISGDGRFVTFSSYATNLVAGDTNRSPDAFVHDRQTGATSRVSVTSDGTEGDDYSFASSISGDGRFVTFSSYATNLVAGDTNLSPDAFVHDRQTGATSRVGVASDGTQADLGSYAPDVSDDGSHVAFGSGATNLVAGDTNERTDVFVHSAGTHPVVSVGDVSVHEGDAGTAAATFIVSLSVPSAATVTVPYTTGAGTAGAEDFTAKSGTVTLAAGATSATVEVPVAGDSADEANEAFVLTLSSPGGAVIGDGTGAGTILDDDPPAVSGRRVAIGDVAVHEGDTGGRSAVFTVSLSKASTSPVSVSFATSKGTAIGTDFTAKSGKLKFAPGTTSLTLDVPITPDALVEGDESFSVTLSGASGATISDAAGLGTIIDND
ncbi:MAG: hypothetical protein M3N32_08255 [Actinomycetota bacterium]|nr:hypothetical protein [Actinomycetota bacterium]